MSSRHIKKSPRRDRESLLTALTVLLLSLSAVATGLSLPALASEIQTGRVEALRAEEELGSGALRLSSDGMILQKLRLMCRSPGQIIPLEDSFLSSELSSGALEDIFAITKDTGLYTGGKLSWSGMNASALLIIPEGDMAPMTLWQCQARMENAGESLLLSCGVDEASGLIMYISLSGQVPAPQSQQALNALSRNLSEYYGFSDMSFSSPNLLEEGSGDRLLIHLFQAQERVWDMPVTISGSGWSIGGTALAEEAAMQYGGESPEEFIIEP